VLCAASATRRSDTLSGAGGADAHAIGVVSRVAAPVNLLLRPLSWFDAFTRAPGDPPVGIEAWLTAERDLRKINGDAS